MSFFASILASLFGSTVASYVYPGSDTEDEALPAWAVGLIGTALAAAFLGLSFWVVIAATGTLTDVTRSVAGVYRGLFKLVASMFAVVGL